MENIQPIVDLLANYGMAFAVTIYFLIKDWKLTQRLTDTLSAVNEHLRKEEQSNELKNMMKGSD